LSSLPHRPTCHIACTSRSSCFEHPGNIWWRVCCEAPYYTTSSSPFLHRPSWTQMSLPAPYFWTPSAYVFPLVWGTRFYIRITRTGKIIVLYSITFIYLESKWEDKLYGPFLEFGLLLMSSWTQFWFVRVVLECLNFFTHSKDLLLIFFVAILSCFLFMRQQYT
jgi:hypothetical protein